MKGEGNLDVADPLVEEDAKSGTTTISDKTQTRFNFYNAEELKSATTQESDQDNPPKEPTRFSYYNPEEVHKTAPLHLPQPIDLSKLGFDSTEISSKKATVSTNEKNEVDSIEILRSLQETELHLKKNGDESNPYETAIHDALAMLRSSKSSAEDKIMESRESVYSEHREAEVRSREERLAKYAAKIVETAGRPLTVSSASSDDTPTLQQPLPKVDQTEVDRLFRARAEDPVVINDEKEDILTRVMSREGFLEEEVQKGVERVLMAILERAGSQGRAEIREAVTTDRLLPPSRRTAEEYYTDDENDEEELQSSSQYTGSTSGNKRSVVDELLAEKDDNGVSLSMVLPASPQSLLSKLTSEIGVGEEICRDNGTKDVSDDEAILVDESEEEEDHALLNYSASLTQVLGPLSGKNKTGVVLESSDSTEPDVDEEDSSGDDDYDDATKSDAPSSILESLSSAVKDAESFMSYVTAAIHSPGADSAARKRKDKYYADNNGDEDFDKDLIDNEANELMRSLCAHLLPFGVDKSTKHLTEIPPWDDSNPNEPGYRIIRLSKSQLRRVEREFERMVNGVKRTSERDLSKEGLSLKDASNDWNGFSGSSHDQRFAKDLEEAEDLLDREEKLRADLDNAEHVKKASMDDMDDEVSETDSSEVASADDTTLLTAAHPDFPGVKSSGKGEMGDLEFFNLPVIFKSHVTGFEPTKDLYLEPGNVVAGQYLVENELGSAAFSTAYRCIDLNSDASGHGDYHEEVCLKVIKNTKDFFDQSLDEIKILELLRQTGKCNENNILEMKTFFYHREHLIIVTELLRQNLFEFGKFIIENNEEPYFTRKRLCYLTRQVLKAFDFIHKIGLVHSDVKPENILLASYSRAKVKLIDFGSSCYLTDRQSSYIQSRSYRAPEVVLGLPYDGRIDIWSLGCVVAEMYTGDVTFQNDSIVSMLSRIEAICGPFPRHMIAQGRQSNRFFSKSGLLYELVEADERRTNPVQDDDESGLFDVFQPKRTTLAARLGFDPQEIKQPTTPEGRDRALFVDFCQSLLTIDPDSRPTAAQALQHPWIISGEMLTEEDIKYPSN